MNLFLNDSFKDGSEINLHNIVKNLKSASVNFSIKLDPHLYDKTYSICWQKRFKNGEKIAEIDE